MFPVVLWGRLAQLDVCCNAARPTFTRTTIEVLSGLTLLPLFLLTFHDR